MNDRNKILNILKVVADVINVIVMFIIVILEKFQFNALRHVILCGLVLLFIIIHLVFDRISKSGKGIFSRVCWYVLGLLWLINLILNLFKI
jgi:hypothetical protein